MLFVLEVIRFLNVFGNFKQFKEIVFKKAITLVKVQRMLPWLSLYPNNKMASLLTEGFMVGFDLPAFDGSGCAMVSNLRSVK